MRQSVNLPSRTLNSLPLIGSDWLVVVGQLDGKLLLRSHSEEDSPRIAQIRNITLVPLDEDGNSAGARTGVINSTALQLLLRVLEHL